MSLCWVTGRQNYAVRVPKETATDDFSIAGRVHGDDGPDFAGEWLRGERPFEAFQSAGVGVDSVHHGLGVRRDVRGVCRHRMWQQGCSYQSGGYVRIRRGDRKVYQGRAIFRGTDAGSVCRISLGVDSLWAALEGDRRSRVKASVLLRGAGDSEFCCESGERDHLHVRAGVCSWIYFFEGRADHRPGGWAGPLPRRVPGVGHRPIARGNDWLYDESCAGLSYPDSTCGAPHRGQRRLRLGLCADPHPGTLDRRHIGGAAASRSSRLGEIISGIARSTDHLPLKAGARFSRKWATPSLKSSLRRLATISSTARSKDSAKV